MDNLTLKLLKKNIQQGLSQEPSTKKIDKLLYSLMVSSLHKPPKVTAIMQNCTVLVIHMTTYNAKTGKRLRTCIAIMNGF